MENNKDTVTVGVSVYNDEENILALLQSLIRQDVTINETLVVNDGSRDGTLNKLKEVSRAIASTLNLRIIDLDRNMGFANALNIIFKASKSKYLIIVPSDVILSESDILKKMIEGCKTKKDVGLTCGWHKILIKNSFSPLARTYRFSSILLERLFKNIGPDILATGAIWAMPRRMYKSLQLPVDLYRIDAYIYLQNLSIGKDFVFVSDAKPTITMGKESFKQYIYRQARTRTVPAKHIAVFGDLAIKEFRRPDLLSLSKAFFESFISHPIDGFCWANFKVISYVYRLAMNPQPSATWRTDETS